MSGKNSIDINTQCMINCVIDSLKKMAYGLKYIFTSVFRVSNNSGNNFLVILLYSEEKNA